MEQLELIQKIGNEICEGCGPYSDCGEEPENCYRVANALAAMNEYLSGQKILMPDRCVCGTKAFHDSTAGCPVHGTKEFGE